MLIDLESVVPHDSVKGVLHVGAHLAEEAEMYARYNVPVLWVEANTDLITRIQTLLMPYAQQWVVQGLAYDKPNAEVQFNITNFDSMSSSVFEFGTHPQFSPEIVVVERRTMMTTTIDQLVQWYWGDRPLNLLAMDIQGAELLALQGAWTTISVLDYIYCEVNSDDVYKGCARVEQIDGFLGPRGFTREVTRWVDGQGWGDALYVRS